MTTCLYLTIHYILYHGNTSLNLSVYWITMGLHHSTWLYITRPWLHFTLLDSTFLFQGSTSLYLTLHYSTMALLHSTSLYLTLQWAPLDSTLLYHGSPSFHLSVHCSTLSLLHSTWFYITLLWFSFTPLECSLLYPFSTSLNQLDSPLLYHGSTSLYFTLHSSTMALLHCTWLYISPSWLYFTLLDTTFINSGSTSLYLPVIFSTMALLHSTWLYTFLYLGSTSLYWVYITLPSLYFTVLNSTLL